MADDSDVEPGSAPSRERVKWGWYAVLLEPVMLQALQLVVLYFYCTKIM
jgi:hypothetical protein